MTFLCVAEDFVGKLFYYSVSGPHETSCTLFSRLQIKLSATLSGNME